MPQIVFSDEEKGAIEAVVAEFDPEYHQLTQGLREILSEDDWRNLVRLLDHGTARYMIRAASRRPRRLLAQLTA